MIVHQLTALSGSLDLRHFDRDFAQTNRLRTEGTDHPALGRGPRGRRAPVRRPELRGLAVGAHRRPGEDRGRPARSRPAGGGSHDPRGDPPPGAGGHRARAGSRGSCFATGASTDPGPRSQLDPPVGEHVEAIRKRKFPIVGDGGGVWSFVHIEDAAEATVDRGRARRARHLQRRRRRPGRGPRLAARCAAATLRREAAEAGPALARPAARRRGGDGDDDRDPRRLEREGEARARLAAAPPRACAGASPRAAADGDRTRSLYEELRPRAFAIAYRMLGSVARGRGRRPGGTAAPARAREAGEAIESPPPISRPSSPGWRSTSCARRGSRRETYVGEWLPEPIVTDPGDDPAAQAELADSLSLAFLVLLECLTPEQRAVFLLREVFDYPYDRIAAIVGRSEDASRQLAARARRRVDERRPRCEAAPEHGERLARQFFGAVARRRPRVARARCSPRTSSCTATAAARRRRWPARSTAAPASPGRWSPGRGRRRGSAAMAIELTEINGGRGDRLAGARRRRRST